MFDNLIEALVAFVSAWDMTGKNALFGFLVMFVIVFGIWYFVTA